MTSQRYEFAEEILGHYMDFMAIKESDFHLALAFENQNGLNIDKQVKTVIKSMNQTEKQHLIHMKMVLDKLPINLMAELLDKDIIKTTKFKQKRHMHILGNTNTNQLYDLTLYDDKYRITIYKPVRTENIAQYEQELANRHLEPSHIITTKVGKLFGLSEFCDTNNDAITNTIDTLTEQLKFDFYDQS